MGCLQSKNSTTAKIGPYPVGQADEASRRDNTDVNNLQLDSTTKSIQSRHSAKKKIIKRRDSLGGSSESEDTCLDGDRGFSATSKTSKHSSDSGLGDDYSHIITEHSEHHVVEQIENNFQEKEGLNLEITGLQCPRRLSARDKLKQEEARVMQSLRDEGFITMPKGQSSGGLSFEIVQSTPMNQNIHVGRLTRLEKKRKNKKKVLTEEQIKEKLQRAERRRKQREEEMLQKIRIMEKAETIGALDAFAQRQKEKEESQTQKMGSAIDNREKHLKEVRDKLKEKERHAQEVRRRKLLHLDDVPHPDCETNETT